MFAPPRDISTEIFARLPDKFRRKDTDCEFARVQTPGHRMDCFLEGPSFDREGNLYCVDIAYGRIFRASPQAEWDLVAEYDGTPNGLKIAKDGRIFIADYKHGIMALDPDSGRVSPFCIKYRLEGFKGCNDLFFAANGDLYFTDQGQTGLHDPSGRVYRLKPNGALDLLIDTVPSPNGLVMNRDESRLYVAVTRANAVWRLPLIDDGVTKVGNFIQLSGGHAGPDGLALDEQGGLVIAHAGFGCVWHFTELGEPIARIRSCTGLMTTNVAFGGADRKDLYITESATGTILRARLSVAGKVMYSHQ
ncbi:MAG TPA: SMP-30/gluconolactonase/LRE family protein [Burkholderiales bacterium]|nr:SMP-30/gluconolactonase/LRE family protein [Burkholderiales bacterium]